MKIENIDAQITKIFIITIFNSSEWTNYYLPHDQS